MGQIHEHVTGRALATDPDRLSSLFHDEDDLLPLWIAEPYLELAPPVRTALVARAQAGWYGYESRPSDSIEAFWDWMRTRHGWDGTGLEASVSPSVGTSIGVLLEHFSKPGDGVILQPPVFTDFKPLVVAADRSVVRSPLVISNRRYTMDLADLEAKAADPATTAMILCNPHNPVGRVWSPDELVQVATICAANGVFVISDEIHADLALPPHRFTSFAAAATGTDVAWAATHGPIKTFGLAGVCDSLLIASSNEVTSVFRKQSSRLHLTRNNVFSLAAFEAAYKEGGPWLDELLEKVQANAEYLSDHLPNPIQLVKPEATYLAWLDFRGLDMEVPELARWLAAAGLALSPGHWFGREGAGFARMTIATARADVADAVDRLTASLR